MSETSASSESTNISAASLLLEVSGMQALTEDQREALVSVGIATCLFNGQITGFSILIVTFAEYELTKLYVNSATTLINEVTSYYPVMLSILVFGNFIPRLFDAIKRFKEIRQVNEHAVLNQKSPIFSAIKRVFIGDAMIIIGNKVVQKISKRG